MLVSKGLFNLIVSMFLTAALLSFSGCGQPQQQPQTGPKINMEAVSLYVDAMMLDEINEHDEALGKLDAAIKLAHDFALAYSFKGDIYQKTEEYEKSADSYESATGVNPWSFPDFFKLGEVCRIFLEQFTRAVKAYVNACDLEPEHYGAHIGAARCYYELDEYDEAFEYASRAKEIDPDTSEAEGLLGDVLSKREDYEQAVDSYRRALEIDGNKPEIMVSLAYAYLKIERFEAAEELLTSAIELDPERSVAYQYLGWAQLKLQKRELAFESYKKAVEIAPDDWMAHKGLGVMYVLQAGKENPELKAKGLEHWKRSLAIKPDQPKLKALLEKNSE